MAKPTFSPAAGTYTSAQTVAISTTTSGASIRYTTDGTTPSETAGTLYSGPVSISSTTTLNAIAYETGWTDSSVKSGVYTITGTVANPSFSPAAGTYTPTQMITISTTTPGASIRYTTNGNTPSQTAGTLYSGPVSISSTTTLNAIAYETGWTASGVTSGVYTIIQAVANPTFSPAGNTYTSARTVAISTSTPGASISYTTDGSTPSQTAGTLYSGPVTIASTTTLNAIAYETGWTNSGVTSEVYTITGKVANPTFSPAAGTYITAQTVAITTATPGASINYTTDGSTPSGTAGTLYAGPISVAATTTVKAIAYEAGWTNSGVTSGVYKITGTVANPSFSPAAGTFTSAQTVTISTTTSGASIRYTVDGTAPSETAGKLYSSPVSVSSTTDLNAIAYQSGWADSGVTAGLYTITGTVGNPNFSPAGGTYTSGQTVTMSTPTSGASIRYTTDGSRPSATAGTLYSGPVSVPGTTTVKAIAYETGATNSGVTSEVYTITLAITTTSLPNGAAGTSYSQMIAAAGGTLPYTWAISSGTLPGGMTLAASTGVIGGTPSATGTFPFTVAVTDANNNVATKALTVLIVLPAAREYIRMGSSVVAIENPATGSGPVGPAHIQTVCTAGRGGPGTCPTGGGNAYPGNISATIFATAGNSLRVALIAPVSYNGSGQVACSDGYNTYTSQTGVYLLPQVATILSADNIVGGALTIVCTAAITDQVTMFVSEFSGISSTVDTSSVISGVSGTSVGFPATSTLTTSHSPDLIYVVIAGQCDCVWPYTAAPAGLTVPAGGVYGGTGAYQYWGEVAYMFTSSAGSQSFSFSWAGNDTPGLAAVAFYAAP